MSIDDYRPTFVVEAVYDLRADDLLRRGIHAVLVDLDNTLIAWNNPDGTPEVRAWLDEMTMADISVVVVSNNKHSRVNRAVSRFGVDFVSRAMKPLHAVSIWQSNVMVLIVMRLSWSVID